MEKSRRLWSAISHNKHTTLSTTVTFSDFMSLTKQPVCLVFFFGFCFFGEVSFLFLFQNFIEG